MVSMDGIIINGVKQRFFVILAAAFLLGRFFACSAYALGRPENVLVVQNGSSAVSMRVASYYMQRRCVPESNLFTVYTADAASDSANQVIPLADYYSSIEQPIRSYLAANGMADSIQYIVLTKGIPHIVSNDPLGGPYGPRSVDSLLAAMDLVNPLIVDLTDESGYLGTVAINRYWRAQEPFTHAKFGGYLVTRLDGYTESDAKSLVDRSLAEQTMPYRVLLDVDPNFGLGVPDAQPKSILTSSGEIDPDYSLYYDDFNADMIHASQIAAGRRHLSVELENTTSFVSGAGQLSIYFSWGSNDHHYDAANYHAINFAYGGVAETAVSTSARTFYTTSGGQSLIADLISQGAAGAKGYATEPFLDAVASPTVFVDLFSSGRNLAESYYAASRFLAWKDVVIGDPLCCLTGMQAASISDAKSYADGTLVSIVGKKVTAGTDAFGDRFYIEEDDRSSGIQVYLGGMFLGISEGSVVTVRGVLAVKDGERVIVNASVISSGMPVSRSINTSTSNTPVKNMVKPKLFVRRVMGWLDYHRN